MKVCTGSSSDEEPDASNVRFGEDPGLPPNNTVRKLKFAQIWHMGPIVHDCSSCGVGRGVKAFGPLVLWLTRTIHAIDPQTAKNWRDRGGTPHQFDQISGSGRVRFEREAVGMALCTIHPA